MARNNGPLIPDEDIATRSGSRASTPPDDSAPDSRFLDLDSEEQSPFLRGQKRVPVRRGALPKKAASRIKIAAIVLAVAAAIGGTAAVIYSYGEKSWRFRLESSDQLEIAGVQNVSRRQIMEVMGGDIGKNVFFIPLDERKKQLEEIPWVESAAVARLLPNRLRVTVTERTPVAFAQLGNRIVLVDSHGVVMELPPNSSKKYSFPVIVGMGESEPLSTRAARMKIFTQLVSELDADGTRYSQDLSEVDLADPEDVKVTVSDPQGEVLVHLGSGNFAERFRIYKANLQQWRQQVDKLASVDLRYDRQVIVNPDAAKEPVVEKPVPAKPAPSKRVAKAAAKPIKKPVKKKR
ncbi:MAG TPA: FtsQ-type POTRA domain-containing protein [Terriglobales bacterium]|nr:FtsQ-type POTRA domain-containing protein [Terriglobales bacterium]